ncbi:hypothetical protein C8F01DRAFT_1362266 [Mycena amicta]|nr:hypothetical protein C8F01DRAFT_1362266 [Mycena amicta]
MLASPFIDILHTNVVPSEAQCDEIRAYLQKPLRTKEAKADEEVSRLEKLLATAIQTREALRELVNAHVALISPMRRVPDDILRVVFLAVNDLEPPTLHPKFAPMILSHICQRWRQVALSTPRLWAAIPVTVSFSVDHWQNEEAIKNIIVSWLERSGIVPLELSLSFRRCASPSLLESHPLSLLLSVPQRWKSIELELRETIETGPLSALTAVDLSQLQRVHIDIFWSEPLPAEASTGHNIRLNLLESDTLRSFSFRRPGIRIPSAPRILDNTGASATHTECKLLQRLDIRLSSGHEVAFPATKTILLPHLTEVILHAGLDNVYKDRHMFDFLHTPAMRFFEFHGSFGGNFSDFLRPISFLTCLRIFPFVSAQLITALDALPLLQELHLESMAFAPYAENALLTLLRTRCRQLRILHLKRMSGLADSDIVQFVKERTLDAAVNGVTRLMEFRCSFERQPQLDTAAELQDSVAEGLVLDLCYPKPRR